MRYRSGNTLEEANAKLAAAKARVSVNGGLARFCGFTNVDLSGYEIDEEFDFEGKHHDNSIQGVRLPPPPFPLSFTLPLPPTFFFLSLSESLSFQ